MATEDDVSGLGAGGFIVSRNHAGATSIETFNIATGVMQ